MTTASSWLRLGRAFSWACLALLLIVGSGPARADVALESVRYRCDDMVLLVTRHSGAVDESAMANQRDGTLPGAFVVLQSETLQLQLPRTNNAGAPSYTDGRWWWSLADGDHPDFRQRLGQGSVRRYACQRDGA